MHLPSDSESVFDFIQELFIHPVLHITDGNIGVGALAGGRDFHGESGVPDSAANQGCIKNQGFNKTISGAPHNLIFSGSLTPREG